MKFVPLRVVAVAVPLAALAFPSAATAVLPAGNLLANPGFEQPEGGNDSSAAVTPVAWQGYGKAPQVVAVKYGAPGGFPTKAEGTRIAGGNNFLAGGPFRTENGIGPNGPQAYQDVNVLSQAQPEIDSGQTKVTLSACLGGYLNQSDAAKVFLTAQVGTSSTDLAVVGPVSASDRGGATTFVARSATGAVPAHAHAFQVIIYAPPTPGYYNDAYADNVDLRIGGLNDVLPTSSCQTGSSGSGGNENSNLPDLTGSSLSVISKSAKLDRRGRIGVRFRCNASPLCAGSMSLMLNSSPATHSRTGSSALGSKTFSVASGATATVKVKPKKRIIRRLRKLSKAKLANRSVTAAFAKTGASSATTSSTLALRVAKTLRKHH